MATRNSTRSAPADLHAILGRFSAGMAVITVACRSLDAQEIAGNEESALRTGLALLNAVYNELDEASR